MKWESRTPRHIRGGYLDGYTAGLERAAEIVEAKERDRYERVGDPRVPHFESYYAAAIRKEIGE